MLRVGRLQSRGQLLFPVSPSTKATGSSEGTAFPFAAAHTPTFVDTQEMSRWRTHT